MILNAGIRTSSIVFCLAGLLVITPISYAEEKVELQYQLETMTVTAQKREEDVQKVPVSMNTFDNIEIRDAGISSTSEITRFVPNVFFKKATMENIIVVRGVSSVDASTVGPVGVYIDDINYPLHFMHNIDLFDVERLELLRGPQGTLYGRNAESGVLNIVTKQPNDDFQAEVKADYGFYDTSHGNIPTWKTGVSLSGPIIKDKLYMGLSVQVEESDGYMKNNRLDREDAAGIDHQNVRGTIRWEVSDRLELSLVADNSVLDDKQDLYRIFVSDGGLKNSDREETNGFYDSNMKQEGSGQIVKIKYAANTFDLLSITGKRDYSQDSKLGTSVGLYDMGVNVWEFDDKLLSQEIRLSSKEDRKKLKWLLGFYVFNEDTDIYFSKFSDFQIRETDIEKSGTAIFAQATLNFWENFHFTLGGRNEHLKMDGSQDLQGLDWSGNDISADYSKSLDYDEFLPKVVFAYDADENIMVYLSAAKGYLEGGYNYAQSGNIEEFVFDPEYTWNYEFGTKTNWFSNRLQANCSIYYIAMEDKQVSEYTAGGGIAQISNAAEAHSKGLEMELKALVTQGLNVFASVGFIDAEIDEWSAGSSDFSGNKIPNTPEYTYNAGIQYRHANGFFGRADLMGTGEMYGDVQNHSHVKLDAYELLNLHFGYETDHFDVVFWCKNVFDEEYFTSAFDYGDANENIGVAQNGEPRSYGISTAYRF